MTEYKRERHKPFKGRKGRNAISKRKGRVETKKMFQNTTKHFMSKVDRKNAAKVAQKLKSQELLANTKIFSGIRGAPKIVTVVPLTSSVGNSLSLLFLKSFEIDISSHTILYRSEKFRSNMMFIACSRKLLDILSLASVSDFIVFVMDASSVELDEWARQCLKCLCAQGMPNIIPALVNSSDISFKKFQSHKKEWIDFFKSQYSCQKVYDINDNNEFNELERIISQHQLKSIHWRDSHPYMISNDVNFVESEENVGTLVIKGYIRGSRAFDTKYPVNICGHGQFHIHKIESAIDNRSITRTNDVMMNMNQLSTNENEESIDHDHISHSKRIEKLQSKRFIKGMSEYQAAWIVESESEGEDESNESSTYEELSTDSSFSVSDQDDQDDNEEYIIQEDELMKYRKKSVKNPSEEEKNDKDFPDELDTPMNIDARTRFKKYQGLKSFRHATWDTNDEIPDEYSRICQFDNINLSEKKALEIPEESLFSVGDFITLHLENVPLSVFQSINSSNNPLICFGLLKYEDMVSILHFTISRSTTTWSAPVKSKEQFVMLYGYRKYIISPIFSEKSVHEKSLHKYLRFLHPERSGIVQHQQHAFGSVYGHVQFGSPPILLFKCKDHFPDNDSVTFCEEPAALVAFGVLNNIDPSKCIIKRVILTGYPFKIHRKTAVVRYMFFNPEDVKYFKQAYIYTKSGKQGRILSSLGTHGYMKCAFDRQLQQQDIVCMNLYRRIFPLWSFKEQIASINDMDI